MNMLWLLLNDTLPSMLPPGCQLLWCPPAGTPGNGPGEKCILPGSTIPPLCHALYAVARFPAEGPLMISTSPCLPDVMSGSTPPARTIFRLTGPDEGWIHFHSMAEFRQYAQGAIRVHNPASGPLRLQDLWYQWCLAEGEMQYDD